MLAEGVNPMAVAGHLGDTLETLQRVFAHWMRDDRNVPAAALDRILAIESADSSRTAAVCRVTYRLVKPVCGGESACTPDTERTGL
jgi:hypothetical protein